MNNLNSNSGKNGTKECTFYSELGCQNNLIPKKGFDILWDEAFEIIGQDILNETEKLKILRYIKHAYNFGKIHFDEIIRDDGDRYFEHLKEVALIILRNFPKPSYEKIIIALLHDIIEDTDIDFHTIEQCFGIKVALAVQAISKRPEIEYIENKFDKELIIRSNVLNKKGNLNDTVKERKNNEKFGIYEGLDEQEKEIASFHLLDDFEERAINELNEAKEKRNNEYFGHMLSFEAMHDYIINNAKKKGYKIVKNKVEGKKHLTHKELVEITWNTFDVKFADRIHNLKTQWDPNNIGKVKRKIIETKQYFLPIAKKINHIAYEMMKELIYCLEIKLMCVGEQVEEIIAV